MFFLGLYSVSTPSFLVGSSPQALLVYSCALSLLKDLPRFFSHSVVKLGRGFRWLSDSTAPTSQARGSQFYSQLPKGKRKGQVVARCLRGAGARRCVENGVRETGCVINEALLLGSRSHRWIAAHGEGGAGQHASV